MYVPESFWLILVKVRFTHFWGCEVSSTLIKYFFTMVPFFIQLNENRRAVGVQQQLMANMSPSVAEMWEVWITEETPNETEGELKLYLVTQTSTKGFYYSLQDERRQREASNNQTSGSFISAGWFTYWYLRTYVPQRHCCVHTHTHTLHSKTHVLSLLPPNLLLQCSAVEVVLLRSAAREQHYRNFHAVRLKKDSETRGEMARFGCF